jgi:hypothetical protein
MSTPFHNLTLIEYRAPAGSLSTSRRDTAHAVKRAIRPLLKTPDGLDAVMPFKRLGSDVTGHRISDNAKAFEALQRVAPEPYRSTLATVELSLFHKSQLLNAVLREEYILDSKDKIVATRGARP